MMKLTKIINSNLKKFLIATSFVLLWIILLATQILLIEKSYTLITNNYSSEVLILNDGNSNLISRRFSAKLNSTENYLGIVAVNFDQKNIMSDGKIVFRIKEEGKKSWYYENTYDAKQLNDLSFYPFGFPIIENSYNKKYLIEFELVDTKNPNKKLALSKHSIVIASLHKYPKEPLLDSKSAFTAFFYKKIANIIHNNYQIFGSLICLFPFIFYLLQFLIKKKYLTNILIAVLLGTVLIDSVYIYQFFDMAYITIAAVWLVLLKGKKDADRYSFGMGVGLLGLSTLTQILQHDVIVEKAASWAFLFLIAGLIQCFINYSNTE